MIITKYFLVYTDQDPSNGAPVLIARDFEFKEVRDSYFASLPKHCKLVEKFERKYEKETTYTAVPWGMEASAPAEVLVETTPIESPPKTTWKLRRS